MWVIDLGTAGGKGARECFRRGGLRVDIEGMLRDDDAVLAGNTLVVSAARVYRLSKL